MSVPLPYTARRIFGVAIDGVVFSPWSGSDFSLRSGGEGERLDTYVLTRFRWRRPPEPDALDLWCEECQRGDIRPRQVTIFLQLLGPIDVPASPVYDLTLREAWPSRRDVLPEERQFAEEITLTCAGATQEEHPAPPFSIRVCIDDVPVENAQVVSIKAAERAEPMDPLAPGRAHFDDVEVKRVRGAPDALDRWYEACQRGDVQPRYVQVYKLLRGPDITLCRLLLHEAWPLRRESDSASDPALESIVLRCSWVTQSGF